MSLIIAAVLFTAYVANVVIGATTGAPLLGDVGEMMLLFAASVAFTVAILSRESQRDARMTTQEKP